MAEPRLFSQPAALGGSVEFAVEIALGANAAGEDIALWQPDDDGALWDTKGQWSGQQLSWVDITSRAQAANTKRGRDRWEQQFRVGSMTVRLDNQDGIFNPDSNRPPGAVALRPGRWLRILGRNTADLGTPAAPGVITFDAVADTPHVAAAAFPVADLDLGFDITGTFRIGSGNLDQARLINAWTSASGQRSFTLHWSLNGSVRFALASGGSSINLDSDAIYFAGVEHTFHAVHRPGQFSELTVDGDLYTSLVTVGTLDLNPEPLTAGTRSDLIEPRTNDFWIRDLQLHTVGGADARVAAADSGNGPLDGVAWTDALGTDWLGVGDVVASGFIPGTPPAQWIPLWTGQIDGMTDRYTAGAQGIDSIFAMLDFGARFQIDDPPALESPIPPGQLTGDRVNQLLDLVDWPQNSIDTEDVPQGLTVPDLTVGAGETVVEGNAITITFEQQGQWRDIDQGLHTMAGTNLPQSRWAEMQVAATAEGGAMFINAYGIPTFRDRDWLTDKLAAGVPKFTVGAVASDIKVIGADTDWSQQRVYGDVQMARKGTTDEVVRRVSDDSIALYGPRTFSRFDIECETENQLVALVERFLASAQFDRSRLESIDLVPTTAEGITQLLNVEVGDLIRVTVQTDGVGQWSYTDDYFVQKVTQVITDEDWVTSLRIDAATFDVPLLPAAYTEGFDNGFDSQDPD